MVLILEIIHVFEISGHMAFAAGRAALRPDRPSPQAAVAEEVGGTAQTPLQE